MSTKRRFLRRVVPAAVLAALAIAAPASGSTQGFEATEWLSSQLKPTPASESAYCESFSPAATVGQTIDCMLAFDAAARSLEAKREATYAWIRENMDDYVGEESCAEEPASLSAGAVAKLALAVLSRGDDPRSVEGRDLIADLECMQVEAGPEAGRFSDIGANDFSNVFGQSLALVSLKSCEVDCGGAPEPEVEEALEEGAAYLRGQQCTESEPETLNGAFRSPLGLVAGECSEEPPFEPENLNAVDVDSTGAAVQGLYAEGSGASEAAGKEALNWLEAVQQPGGYWESYCDFGMPASLFPSVNSTASAAMAYTQDSEISTEAAQGWLAGVVEGGSGGLPSCKASGSSDLLATAQGVLGLFGASYPQLVGLP